MIKTDKHSVQVAFEAMKINKRVHDNVSILMKVNDKLSYQDATNAAICIEIAEMSLRIKELESKQNVNK